MLFEMRSRSNTIYLLVCVDVSISKLNKKQAKSYSCFFFFQTLAFKDYGLWVGGRYYRGMWRWEGRLTSTISNQSSLWAPTEPDGVFVRYTYIFSEETFLSDISYGSYWFACEAVLW